MFSLHPGCRLHGAKCRTPWGYDLDHTDSTTPYTLDELAGRIEAPHLYAYPSMQDYEEGFSLWRSLCRDASLSPLERLVAECARWAPLAQTWSAQDHSCPIVQVLGDLEGLPAGFDAALAALCPCRPT